MRKRFISLMMCICVLISTRILVFAEESENQLTELKKYENLVREEPENPQIPQSAEDEWSGDYVYFGKYMGKALKWRVLKNDGENILLMTDSGVGCFPYQRVDHLSEFGNTWESSTLRNYLNTDFIDKTFTEEEQEYLQVNYVSNGTSEWEKFDNGIDTEDKVYLLSFKELLNKEYGFYDSTAAAKSRVFSYEDYGKKNLESIYTRTIWGLTNGYPFAFWIDENGAFNARGSWFTHPVTWDKHIHPVIKISLDCPYWTNIDDSFEIPKQEEFSLKLTSAVYKYGSLLVNLLETVHSIETSHEKFELDCTVVNKESVTKFELYSGNKKVAETKNGKFERIDASKFTSGKDVSVKVYGKQKVVTTQLLLEVKDKNPFVKSTLKLGGKDGLALSLGDEVPFVGGSDISVNLPEIPVNAIVEDGKIKIGINIKEKELYSANSYEGVTTTTKPKKKTMKQIISDMKYTLYKTGNINKDWKGYLEKSNLKADMPLMEKKTTFTVFGYAEAEWSDSLETVSGEIIVAISGNTTFQKQSVIMYIPITVNCKVTGEGEVDAEVKYDFINQEWSGNVKFDGSVAVEPYAGVGVGTWLSVGVYGQAKLGIRITLLTFIPPTGEKGVDDIYLSGETGIKGYFAKKEVAKVPLLSLKNLKKTGLGKYINDDNELLIYSKKENSLINKKSVRSMKADFSNAEFIWSKNKASLFHPMSMENMRAATLVENAYGAAEPQIIAANGITLIAYLDNDVSRELSNQTVVKYAVYHSASGEFSTPRIALDDGTADYKPQLYTDGTDIYLYYLDSTKSYGSNEDPDIHEYAGTFAVTVARYDASSDAFIKLGTVGRTGHYCYAPAIENREEGLFLTWAENESDDVFGLTEDNSINYAVYSDGAWSDPACITEDLNSVTSIATGKLGADETIAYSIDADNDLTTPEQKLYFANESGTVTEIVEDSVTNLQYVDLPGLSQPVLAFNRNGAVEYLKSASDEPVALFEEGTLDVGSRFTVFNDRIYYLKTTDENSRNLYCASYNGGQWGSVALTDESAYVDAFSVTDDKLVYLLTDADFGEDESGDGEVITSSAIKFLASTETHDLKVENVDFDALNINAGEDLNLELSITNNGTEAVENPVVSFYLKSDPDSCQTVTFSKPIHPGETVQETVVVTAPTDFSDAFYAVKVEEAGYDDIREADNIEEVDLSKTELEIETEYKIIEDEKSLAVYVSNDSNVPSEAYVTVQDSAGNIIYTGENVNVPANESVNISVPLEGLQLDDNGETILKAAVSTNTEEYYLCNNTYEQRIWEIDTWQPVVSDISDEKDDDITNPDKNNGSSSVKNPSHNYNYDYDYEHRPDKVKLKKAKSNKKGELSVKWKFEASDGYQIQYALNKTFTKGKRTKNVDWLKSKITLKKLKSKKKYFVRVRAYNKQYYIFGDDYYRIYGPWSNIKKCKVK